jgi:RecA-family ATPase
MLQLIENMVNAKSFEQLKLMNIQPTEFLVDNILPKGISLLAGKPKAGKSYFLLAIAMSLSNGITFLNENTKQNKILFFAFEDNEIRLKSRINSIDPNIKLNNVYYEHYKHIKEYKTPIKEIMEDYIINHDVKLIIIDTFGKYKLLIPTNKERDDYMKELKIISELKDLADKYFISILLSHHEGKTPRTEDVFDGILGSTGIFATVDTALILHRKRNDDNAVLYIASRDGDENQINLLFQNHIFYRINSASDTQNSLSPESLKIFNAIPSQYPISITDLQKIFEDKNKNTLRNLLYKLVNNGYIVTLKKGLFQKRS